MVTAGGVLLIIGYFFGMLAVADLYRINLQPPQESTSSAEEGFQPSPLSDIATTPAQRWGVYVAATALVVVSMIMVGSQPMVGAVTIIYIMCPLAMGAAIVGWPLRQARKIAIPAATVYLGLGVCLTSVGVFWLMDLWGAKQGDENALLASFATQVGLALITGALLKFSRTPEEDDPAVLEGTANAGVA
jgi:hypothetical protein